MTAAEPILEARDVGKRFGGFTALDGVTLSVARGQITAIIGPNGAGKSTFFNCLSGSLAPSSGRIRFEGRDITGLAAHRFAHLGISKSFQVTNLFPRLTARENVRVAGQALRGGLDLWRDRRRDTALVEQAEALLDLVGLGAQAGAIAESLSHGAQRALEIAVALAAHPRLLLLDEPTAGMSPEEAHAMMQLIQRLATERTVVLVEHRMKLVMGISDHVVVLHNGTLLAEGPPEAIRRDESVRSVYLGQNA